MRGISLGFVVVYVLAWTPYAIVSMWGAFGDASIIPQAALGFPAVLAKCSMMMNPLVYVAANRSHRFVLLCITSCNTCEQSLHAYPMHIQTELHNIHVHVCVCFMLMFSCTNASFFKKKPALCCSIHCICICQAALLACCLYHHCTFYCVYIICSRQSMKNFLGIRSNRVRSSRANDTTSQDVTQSISRHEARAGISTIAQRTGTTVQELVINPPGTRALQSTSLVITDVSETDLTCDH